MACSITDFAPVFLGHDCASLFKDVATYLYGDYFSIWVQTPESDERAKYLQTVYDLGGANAVRRALGL